MFPLPLSSKDLPRMAFESDDETPVTDFLGLASDEEEENENTLADSSCKQKIPQQEPDLSFWRGIDVPNDWTSSLSACEEVKNDTKRKTVSTDGQTNKRVKMQSHDSSAEVKTGNLNEASQTRNLYYVHHRVAPYLHQAAHCKCPKGKSHQTIAAHSKMINRVCWNTAQFSHLLASCSMDGTVKIWNALKQTTEPLRCLKDHKSVVKCVCWSACGHFILSSSFDETARTTSVETGRPQSVLQHTSRVSAAAYHPVDSHLVLTGSRQLMQLWDIRCPSKSSLNFQNKQDFGQVQDLAIFADGRTVVCCSDVVARDSSEVNIMAWDVRGAVRISNQIYQERYTCTRLKIHPTSTEFLAQSQGGYVCVFSCQPPYKMNRTRRYDLHKVESYAVGFDVSADGQFLVSGSTSGEAFVYHYRSGRLIKSLKTGSICMDVSYHPVLASTTALCTSDGEILIWD